MTKMQKIEKLLEYKYQRSNAAMSGVLKQEAELRAGLSKLSQMSASVNNTANSEMSSIGADVIWQAWVARRKTSLNRELAQILAQKEALIKGVRINYGKLAICQRLQGDELLKTKRREEKKNLDLAIDTDVFRSPR